MPSKRTLPENSFHIDDMLARILSDTRYSARRDNWLWCFLVSIKVAKYDRHRMGGDMRECMAFSIKDSNINVAKIKKAERDFLIPDNQLSWITESRRQHEWIERKILNSIGDGFDAPPTLRGRDLLIATIDCWDVDKEEKLKYCAELERQWDEQKDIDKKLEWIKESEDRTCRLLSDWLRKHHKERLPFQRFPSCHEDLLLYFDKLEMTNMEKAFCIATVRKLWRQELRREKNGNKKQCNLTLTNKATKRLEKFCKKYELPRNRIIEILLQMEDLKGAYLKSGIQALREQPINSE